jgi:proteic killer suppression protein
MLHFDEPPYRLYGSIIICAAKRQTLRYANDCVGLLPQRSVCADYPCGPDPIITLDVNHVSRYYWLVIHTFKNADTEAISKGERVKRFAGIAVVARRKLRQLEIAERLEDLRVPPGNRLEALKGNRTGQHSIRINDQFRVCFRWTDRGAEDVEIVDYH